MQEMASISPDGNEWLWTPSQFRYTLDVIAARAQLKKPHTGIHHSGWSLTACTCNSRFICFNIDNVHLML